MRFNPTPDWVLRANYRAGFRAPQIFDEDLHVDNAGGDLIVIENAKTLHEELVRVFTIMPSRFDSVRLKASCSSV